MKRSDAVARIEAIAENVAGPAGLEIVDVELKGSGKNQLLRIFIDRPEGVTHADCELVSQRLSAAIDEDDPIPGSYNLEVSSPGVERRLRKWADWQRFTGKKVKVVLREPVDAVDDGADSRSGPAALKYFEGTVSEAREHGDRQEITVALPGGREIRFEPSMVERANLKFEW